VINFIKLERISIKNHPVLNEKWVQEQIANDPTILGLGDLILRDKERSQTGAGRLDLLLYEQDTYRRYEVEVQLGKTDESHIIRTIEYWDIEKKRYPQYDHCAVIIAEDITSRFLNIIQLFNGNIPIIALQMNAYKVEDKITLIFTKVIDELQYGLIDDDEAVAAITDRNFWETRGSKETVKMVDMIFEIFKDIDKNIEIKYNKYYIGLVRNGQPKNFTTFKAKKNYLRMSIKLDKTEEIENKLNNSNLDLMEYDTREGRYRIRLAQDDIEKNCDLIKELLELSYNNWV